MPVTTFARQEQNQRGYSSNEEYLFHELQRLDLLIQIKLLEKQNKGTCNPLDQFKGLVISDKEVAELLSDTSPSQKSALHLNKLEQLQTEISFNIQNAHQGCFLGLPAITRIFQLTPFEKDCLLVCLAPELDAKYDKLYAYLQDDVTKKNPTIGLILDLLCESLRERHHAIFNTNGLLFKYRLVASISSGEIPFVSRALKIDDRIKDFLIGYHSLDYRVAGISQIIAPGMADGDVVVSDEKHDQMREAARLHFTNEKTAEKNLLFFFHGPKGAGKKTLAKLICSDLGIPLIIADLGNIPEGQTLEETVWFLGREAVLHSSAVCLDGIESYACLPIPQLKSLLKSIETFSRLTFLLAEHFSLPRQSVADHVFVDMKFSIPDETTRIHIWTKYLKSHHPLMNQSEIETLAGKFNFTPGQIRDAVIAARNRAHCYSGSGSSCDNLYDICRNLSQSKLGNLAGKLATKRTWDDIILPPDHMAQMKDLCDQARFRKVVYGDWGFGNKLSAGKGLAVLFSGPPGTGKTLAAEIIAGELQLHLYKIDLSQVVDKYIGETEKNLKRVFSEAERSNAILFFDEADALFGKRSETKDAHDRYANIEVGYLLQSIEEYEGIVILATNLVNNMDEAFQRRLNFIIQFPFPDLKDREHIWRSVYPQAAPISEDLDYPFLAEKLKICGGNIKNIALTSAFYAARQQSRIGMKEIMRAVKREYQKMGKPLLHGDFIPYSDLLGDK